ncbi:MAG: type II toxin-antitoxin system death-on-curing family toxin [Acidobacteriota bacterium]
MKWLRRDTVLAIHKLVITEHGGDDHARDLTLLDSALARPKNISVYEPDSDIARLSAAYGFGIAKNHPFVDGNKRVALAATRTFLLLNGFTLTATQEEKYQAFLGVADGSLSEDELTGWIRAHLVAVVPKS